MNKNLKAEVEKWLDYVCNNVMPSTIKQECTSFVNEYGPVIIQFLATEINPNKICTQIKVCSNSPATVNIASHVSNDIECTLCVFVATAVESLVKDNKTDEEIKDVVEKICNIFSGSLKDQVTNQILLISYALI